MEIAGVAVDISSVGVDVFFVKFVFKFKILILVLVSSIFVSNRTVLSKVRFGGWFDGKFAFKSFNLFEKVLILPSLDLEFAFTRWNFRLVFLTLDSSNTALTIFRSCTFSEEG